MELNWFAVIVAAIAQWLLGWAWYSTFFQKQWLELSGITPDPVKMKQGMMKSMVGGLVSALIMSTVLAMAISNTTTDQATMWHGALLGAILWLGFIATTMINSVLYEQKKFTLFAINSGYYLASLVVMGLILSAWR